MDDYGLTRFLLQRALALVYLIAFLVAANQFRALLGERGLLPVPEWLQGRGWRQAPGLFQLRYSDRFALVLAWSGVGLSVFALSGLSERFGTPVSMAVWLLLWALYLSFVNVGQTWYAFGWETLLLEAGFLAIFLGGAGSETPEVVIWLYRWVLFRVMFGAGLIKLRGDPCWRDLTCLYYHYETQPLPNPLSWLLHRSPKVIHKAGVAFTHLVQLAVPFGYFLPAPFSWVAGGLTVLFQGSLILSGNLAWLNHLTLVLAVSTFNDRVLGWLVPVDIPTVGPRALQHDVAVWGLVVLVLVLSVRPVRNLFRRRQLMNASFEPYHLVNTYGAFGSITRQRYEIVIEGTLDEDPGPESEWREYEFKAKPGALDRRPPIVAPYHLRLDWLMWFAAMSSHHRHPWFVPLLVQLLEGDPVVLGLLGRNPFPDSPPRVVRAQLHLYRFTTPAERRETGRWWERELVGDYVPAVGLR
ncbi:MAG: lipase maturation factor family protein [Gemmatimonadota bacterium]